MNIEPQSLALFSVVLYNIWWIVINGLALTRREMERVQLLKLIESLIGIEGKFKCNTISGIYEVEGKLEQDYYGNVSFRGSTTAEAFEAIHKEKRIDFYGIIDNSKVILLNLCLTRCTYKMVTSIEDFMVEIVLLTDYILTGVDYCDSIKVSSIMATVPNLDFSDSLSWFLKDIANFDFKQTTEDCCVNAEYGEVYVARCRIEKHYSNDEIWKTTVMTNAFQFKVKYAFNHSVDIATALDHISNVRNLFSFLTGKCLSLSTFGMDVTVWNDKFSGTIPCTLFLNDSYKDRFPDGLPRLIPLSCVFKNFNSIWNKWIDLCKKVPSIISLYYEIICGNSGRVDRFLNYARALEVYSSVFREDKCKELKKIEDIKSKNMPLYIRIKDILRLFTSKEYLSLPADEVSNLSKSLSDIRNYFTHYDNDRGMKISMQEIFAASNVLRFILLTLVFDYLGILEIEVVIGKNDDGTEKKEKVIKAMKKSTQFQYLRAHIDMIANLKGSSSGK